MKKTHMTTLALAVSALSPLAFANSESPTDQPGGPDATPTSGETPAPAPAPAPASAAAAAEDDEEALFKAAEEAAAKITQDQAFEFLSVAVGYQLGRDMATGLPGSKAEDLNEQTLLQGVADGLSNRPDPEIANLDVTSYLYAVQKLMAKRAGEELPVPTDLSPEEQKSYNEVVAAAGKISEADALKFFNYFMGYQLGQGIGADFAGVAAGDIRFSGISQGVQSAYSGKVPELFNSPEKLAPYAIALDKILCDRLMAQGEVNLKKGLDFLAENGKKEGVVTTPSGLQYKVLTVSTGEKYDEKKHGANAECSVTYEGRLIDGTVFDATEVPVSFPINGVVPGFSEALKMMPVGSEWEIYIPAELGYGVQGPSIIGSNSVLIFKVKLHGLKTGRGTAGNPIELTPELEAQLRQQGLIGSEVGTGTQPAE